MYSIKNIFLITEASVGNIGRLLGWPEEYVDNFVEHAGNKYAYMIAKLFTDDVGSVKKYLEEIKDYIENSSSYDPDKDDITSMIFVEVINFFEDMWWEPTGGYTEREEGVSIEKSGSMLLKIVKENPNLEKEITKQNGLTNAIKFLRTKFEKDFDYKEKDEIVKFPDGWRWVTVSPQNYAKEGQMMQHCGQFLHTVFSLRDQNNKPYVTADINDDINPPHVNQIRGKQNSIPATKYDAYIKALFDKIGIKNRD